MECILEFSLIVSFFFYFFFPKYHERRGILEEVNKFDLGGAGAGNGGTMEDIGQELGAESIVRDHPLLFPENYPLSFSFSLVSILLRFDSISLLEILLFVSIPRNWNCVLETLITRFTISFFRQKFSTILERGNEKKIPFLLVFLYTRVFFFLFYEFYEFSNLISVNFGRFFFFFSVSREKRRNKIKWNHDRDCIKAFKCGIRVSIRRGGNNAIDEIAILEVDPIGRDRLFGANCISFPRTSWGTFHQL